LSTDITGCVGVGVIDTYTGSRVDILNLRPEDVELATIAHSLSRQCRFGGHCRSHVSVAEHSCHVADWVEQNYPHLPDVEASHSLLLAALLHDGSEAFLVDLPRPLKLALPEYVEIENRVQAAVNERFGADAGYEKHLIKLGDNAVMKAEAQLEMVSRAENWEMEDVEAAPLSAMRWTAERAEAEFIERFNRWYAK
jgi:uncharacterized protein